MVFDVGSVSRTDRLGNGPYTYYSILVDFHLWATRALSEVSSEEHSGNRRHNLRQTVFGDPSSPLRGSKSHYR